MQVEQYIITSNPKKNGSFGTWAKSSGYTKETQELVESGYYNIFSCLKSGLNYQQQTTTEKVLKPDAKPGIFGKYKEKDYIQREIVYRNQIVIVDESFSGKMNLDYIDYRSEPEKAPYRLAKMLLTDNRLLVVRISAIGKCYGDERYGNYFEHGFIFPAGTKLTDEQIKRLPFQKGLTAEQQKNGFEQVLPTLNESQLGLQTKTQATPSLPKSICYGKITVPTDSKFGEIERLICQVGIEKQLSDVPAIDTFSHRLLTENPNLTKEQLDEKYDKACADAIKHEENLDKLEEELAERMKLFFPKETLKSFLDERKAYYSNKSREATNFKDSQECLYQKMGTAEAQKILARTEKTK